MKYNARVLSLLGQGGGIFGLALMNKMKERTDIMVLSSDMSTPAGLDKFKNAYPDNFINVGIAEQNMIGVAAGLTDEGYKTVSVTQACFISMRAFEPVRQYLGYMHSNQILIGLGAGYSLTFLGNTHYALEDIALMRNIPDMKVIAPCDSYEAVKAFGAALKCDTPVYIRLYGGTNTPIVYKQDFEYEIGKAIELKKGNDIQIISTGSMVPQTMKVAEELEKEGYSVSLIDMHTIKPLDISVINKHSKMIVTVEEHFLIGGLGSAVSDYLVEQEKSPAFLKIGVEDRFSKVGDYQFLLDYNGLTAEKILNRIKDKIKSL